jgi:hypothetical protein
MASNLLLSKGLKRKKIFSLLTKLNFVWQVFFPQVGINYSISHRGVLGMLSAKPFQAFVPWQLVDSGLFQI